MPQNVFVGRVAETYDDNSPEMYLPAVLDPAIDFLIDAAGDGAVLEFGIGTGRIALPLSQRGVEVHGVDISADMLHQLQAKPGAETVATTLGDFATVRVPGEFSLVYLVYGRLVIELWIPDLRRFPPGAVAVPFDVSASHLGFDTYDIAAQHLVSHHYVIQGEHVAVFESPHRYAWPSELDLMARIAGLDHLERWSDWDRSPFTSASTKHISVWQRSP